MILSRGKCFLIKGQLLSCSIYSLGKSETHIDVYDLRQLTDITTIEPIEIDAERQSKLRSSAVKKGVATGALVGGVVDALNPGDSIFNGLLLGALVGYLFAENEKDPVAHLTLQFQDGVSLPVVVGRDDLTQLVAVIETNQQQKSEAGVSKSVRPLTHDEIAAVQRRRAKEKAINVALITFIGSFVALAVVFHPIESSQYQSFISGLNDVFVAMGKAFGYSIVCGGLLGLGAYWAFLRSKMTV